MAIITLLTDAGESDHYVAAIKARILSLSPQANIVDISHQIRPFDIGHGAFVLRSVFRDFPAGTVHLVGVDSAADRGEGQILLKLEGHYFLGADNGLLSLLSEQMPESVWTLGDPNAIITFPEKEVLAPAAARLSTGADPSSVGTAASEFKRFIDRQVKATRRQITGNVIRVDHYGNLITNIPKQAFDVLSKGRNFTIAFGGEKFRRIHATYNHADQGECFLIFNELQFLEIGIYKGNASELLGLGYDSVVNVVFDES